MKTFLFTGSVLLSLFGNCQFSRSFFNIDPTFNHQESIALKESSQNVLFHVYSDTASQIIYLKKGIINDLGDLISVSIIPLESNYTNLYPKLSGIASNDDGSYSIAVLSTASNNTLLSYYRITNNSLVENYQYPENLKNGFIQSIDENGFLVTYAVGTSSGLIRISTPSLDFSNTTTEIVDGGITSNTSYLQNLKLTDFVIVNGVEYVTVYNSSKMYKRNGVDDFNSNTLPIPAVNQLFDLINGSNGLLLFKQDHIYSIASDLQFIQENILDLSFTNPLLQFRSLEVIVKDQFYYMFFSNTENSISSSYTVKIDNTLLVSDYIKHATSMSFRNIQQVSPNDFLINGSVNRFFNYHQGFDENYISGIVKNTALILTNDLFSDLVFEEYEEKLIHNQINASIKNGRDLLTSSFQINDTLSAGLIYNSNNGILGLDGSNQFIGFDHSFFPGPITNNTEMNDVIMSKYNRGYYVTRQMIEDHLDDVQWGTPGYIAPFGIRNWPAHGDVSLGQNQNIADFVDVNNNGIYEPYEGDYPAIYGDRCILTVQNTTEPFTQAKVEWHNYFFVFDCSESEAEKNTIFLKSFYINGETEMQNVYFSNFSDIDIGNYSDDYVGTNVGLGMIYTYNGSAFDYTNGQNQGFGTYPPSVGMQILKGGYVIPDGIDNAFGIDTNQSINAVGYGDQIADNEYYTLSSSMYYTSMGIFPYTDPVMGTIQEYNFFQGLWADGSQLVYGGLGYVGSSGATNIPTPYMFPGTSDSLGFGTHGIFINDNWSEQTVNNPMGDRRMVGSSGPFNFGSNQKISFLQAFIVGNIADTTDMTYEDLNPQLFDFASELKNSFSSDTLACGNSFGLIQDDLNIFENSIDSYTIYPNPFTEQITISGLINSAGTITIMSMSGQIIMSLNIDNTEETIDLSTINSGMYMVVITNNNQSSTGLIVKQ